MIRSYESADRVRLLELIRFNTPAYFSATEEQDFSHYLDEEREDYYIVEQEGKIVGCGGINYIPAEQTAIISWDIFHPNAQGRGLGRQLTTYRIDKIKADGYCNRVVVRTSQHTHIFYEKMGFQLKETVKNYWAPGFDLYFMEMTL